MAVKAKINQRSVLRAFNEIRVRKPDPREATVTPKEIADYLIAPQKEVNAHLRELEAKRLLRRRKRKKQTVIVPWSN